MWTITFAQNNIVDTFMNVKYGLIIFVKFTMYKWCKYTFLHYQ